MFETPAEFAQLKVAIVHYWLVRMRGGEKVVEELLRLFPQAHIYTHVYNPEGMSERLRRQPVTETFVGRLPAARRLYQYYLPLMPRALEELDLRGYDLIISSEAGPAKGIIPPDDALHISYTHSPMRYLWNMYADYNECAGFFQKLAMKPIFHRLRQWDVTSAARVDEFVANSTAVARRINKYYRRPSTVIHPPVDTASFAPESAGDFYLCAGQVVPYKRIDLAVQAFNRMGKKLVIIGDGASRELMSQAGPTVSFMGPQPFDVLKKHYAHCKALIYPGEEDFGIVPVEAMASGRPVIAYRRGGALDTVVEGLSGLFFTQQNAETLIDAVERFERQQHEFSPEAIRLHSEKFGLAAFQEAMGTFVQEKLRLQA